MHPCLRRTRSPQPLLRRTLPRHPGPHPREDHDAGRTATHHSRNCMEPGDFLSVNAPPAKPAGATTPVHTVIGAGSPKSRSGPARRRSSAGATLRRLDDAHAGLLQLSRLTLASASTMASSRRCRVRCPRWAAASCASWLPARSIIYWSRAAMASSWFRSCPGPPACW